MRANDFVHLHVHSHYSLLDGTCQFDALLDAVQQSGQDAIALTDHGNLFGSIPFYKAARQRDLRPILGMEAYIATGSRTVKKRVIAPGRRKATYHATLLAANNKGWENLINLASTAYVDGFYYKPRIDREVMKEYGEGIICLSGCLAGEVNQAILAERMDEAETVINEYREIFGSENFYLEVMNHGIDLEDTTREAMKELSKATGAPLVGTNDIHYVGADDWKAQDVALCVGTGKIEADPERFKMTTRELYFKDTEQMAELFSDMPQAVTSTREIADRCDVQIDFGNRFLPAFTAPDSKDSATYFRELCEEGVARKYREITPRVRERLEYEMDVISTMGFIDYFLITWDFIRYARQAEIPVGPGRGSAAGSIVAYALDITQLDPLHYDLLFERFLNSERISMPDIDIDFCKDGRADVIRYVEKKYGRDHVAQIITFGTMKARGVIRDVGRVLDVPLGDVDRIAKKIPNGPKDTLKGALASDPEVQALYKESDQNRRLFDIALKLDGTARHASIHAAGVVISDRPLTDRVPLFQKDDDITTQWSMDILEEVGLLKVDFLGLRTLTIIKEAVNNIAEVAGVHVDIEQIPLDDPKTFELLQRGDSSGVFQLESEGMINLLRRLKPDRFADVIAVLALYRPGPLGSGMVDSYVRRKHGEEAIEYPHPSLEPILAESLGVILYQEQVMRISNVLSGFSMNDADNLRKAMGKKKPEVLARFKSQFVDGAVANGVDKGKAADVFDLIEYFAGYGFNKSHSAAYALVTYQTAWLKANYPNEYMAAVLTCEMISIDKTVEYTEECRAMGIEVLPPDVNRSGPRFKVEDGKVRFALAALKGVGEGAVQSISDARQTNGEFRTLWDLCERVDVGKANKACMEALIWSGAMDSLEGNRAQKCAILEDALATGSAADRDRRTGQFSLFGAGDFEDALTETETEALPSLPEFDEQDRLQKEKDVLGFYLTGHPLNRHRSAITRFSSASISDLSRIEESSRVAVGGMITSVRAVTIRKGKNAGQKMGIARFEDFSGNCDAVLFSEVYLQMIDRISEDKICYLKGEVDRRRDDPSIRVQEIIELNEARHVLARKLTLAIADSDELEMIVPAVHRVLKAHPGNMPVFFDYRKAELGSVTIQAGDEFRIQFSPELLTDLEKVLGTERVVLN